MLFTTTKRTMQEMQEHEIQRLFPETEDRMGRSLGIFLSLLQESKVPGARPRIKCPTPFTGNREKEIGYRTRRRNTAKTETRNVSDQSRLEDTSVDSAAENKCPPHDLSLLSSSSKAFSRILFFLNSSYFSFSLRETSFIIIEMPSPSLPHLQRRM